ncbi:MAG: type II toxin-antitoxin system RelE/ParE family toxin [Candidatus Gracilibacteria bacterium]|nr:type II toxin-antitoxin system RelE/ParE family toxin [Candidatus Gracilibacteria bacterium]MDQ7022626.1 type II toxin-antitoxin system RelE/ParE family toxin [Candidatus Gracilibacteria bacterium]
MEYKIKFGDKIDDDLEKIGDYIERMTFSKEKSEQLVQEILSSIMILSKLPHMYQVFYKKYHSLTVKNKRVIYYIDENKKIIVIYRVLGGYQNYQDYL